MSLPQKLPFFNIFSNNREEGRGKNEEGRICYRCIK